tara:strand:+ start:780 stop:1442 length:663 start_codon:yes stop_codon:yes gene_type:complete
MKKLILTIAFLTSYVTAAYSQGSMGFTVNLADIDTSLSDDIDNNGSTDTTKDISNEVVFGSIFLERELGNGVVVGIDFIPFEAEFESRSTSQSSIKEKGSSTTTGTNKGTADVSKHLTLYVQPTRELDNGSKVFATLGIVRADVESKVQSISSTDKTVDQSLDGFKFGVGMKRDLGTNGFFKLELNRTDYDDISATTSNSTKVTADIDTTVLGLSIGRSF